jgi:hypothetical protein
MFLQALWFRTKKIPVGPNYQVPFADQIKSSRYCDRAVGLITEAKQAEEIVTTGKVIWSLFARGTRVLRFSRLRSMG